MAKPSWQEILMKAAAAIERKYRVKLLVDEAILLEIGRFIADGLASLGFYSPNVAKVAGIAAFWIRKLKPLSIAPDSPNHFLLANERAALLVGLTIAAMFEDEDGVARKIAMPKDILIDWTSSLRYHSHSPYSSITAFELILHFASPVDVPEKP